MSAADRGVREGIRGRLLARGSLRTRSQDVPDLHLALSLDLDRAPGLALELAGDELVRGARDLDSTGRPMRLHAASGVHGVTPEVVQEPLRPDDAGDDRAGVDPDAELHAQVAHLVTGAHR